MGILKGWSVRVCGCGGVREELTAACAEIVGGVGLDEGEESVED